MRDLELLIPLIPGLVLAIRPQVFLKKTAGNEIENITKTRRLRLCGFGLLAATALLAASKVLSPHP
ncbi:MAG TPA: hypothetical protein VKA46_41175 [Gemmataceae bacterium]|nr:hypothetical protein [Gemmataceae bacterium]